MDESNRPEDAGLEGVRRRHSVHSVHHDQAEEDAGDATSSASTFSPTRPSLDASSTVRAAVSERRPDPPSRTPGSTPSVPRVRFSEDIERNAGGDSIIAPASSPPIFEHTATSTRTGAAAEDHPAPSPLSLRTDLEPSPRPGHLGSPSRHASQRSPLPASLSSPPSPQTTGISPTRRNRGYSLRRTLFARGAQGQDATSALDESFQLEEQRSDGTRMGNAEVESQLGDDHGKTADEARHGLGLPAHVYAPAPRGSTLPNYESWLRQRAARARILQKARKAFSGARKAILRIQEIPPSKDGRHLDLDVLRRKSLIDERTGRPYISNVIRSSRYTVWTFLPRQLFAQFSKLANFYFLCVSILQMIPTLSTTGTYTTIVPLLVFVSLSMGKEGYDDYRRYRLDKIENRKTAEVLRADQPANSITHGEGAASPSAATLKWTKVKWEDVQVGDIVKLERDDAAPADLVLLHAKGPNNIAYIETMALDGETSLKSKQPLPGLAKQCGDEQALAQSQAHFVVEDPNLDLYSFEGKVTVADDTKPLTNNEVIYRGSILRNTKTAYGMVIYSGEECKIRMNATKNPRIKAPALQAKVNKVVIIIVIFVVALSIFNTCAYQIWSARTERKSWYLTDARVAFFPIFASFIIMFNTLIPLSLYVSLEIVKLAQIYLMNDIDMYDEVSDTPMEPRTSTINEELGQVR